MLYGLVAVAAALADVPAALYLYVLVDTLLHLGSWAAPRYRLPSDALMMVFAGAALVDLATRSGRLRAPDDAGAQIVPAARSEPLRLAGAAAREVDQRPP